MRAGFGQVEGVGIPLGCAWITFEWDEIADESAIDGSSFRSRGSVSLARPGFFVMSATIRIPSSGAISAGARSAERRYCASAMSYAFARNNRFALSRATLASPVSPGDDDSFIVVDGLVADPSGTLGASLRSHALTKTATATMLERITDIVFIF